MKSLEHQIQADYFRYVRFVENRHPALRWIHAIPNGGHRDIRTATRLKAEGVRAGVWDVFVPHPRSDGIQFISCGLYIEFKAGKNKLTPAQVKFQIDNEAYYDFIIARDWITAWQATEKYLGLKKTA